ncbi:FkbM family methyltransferase [Candidatus Pacearchaeota archaeon]|nr:FkbM family methyltransferase [Candidatus Pacearchaeota archaeon]
MKMRNFFYKIVCDVYDTLNQVKLFRPILSFFDEVYCIIRRKEEMRFYSNFVSKGDLCFDIGANIGTFSDILLRLGCKVIAVEFQTDCVNHLNKKFASVNNFTLVNKAADETIRDIDVFICSTNSLSTISPQWIKTIKQTRKHLTFTHNKRNKVHTTTLDQLITQYGKPVFCKIDVEGGELSVIKGLSQPLSFLSFEFTTESIGLSRDCLRHLSSLGKYSYNYSLRKAIKLESANWMSFEDMMKTLDSMKFDSLCGNIYAKLLQT